MGFVSDIVGGAAKALFGGSSSSSGNQSYGYIKDKFGNAVDTGQQAQDQINQLLGLGGPRQNYINTPGAGAALNATGSPGAATNPGLQNYLDSSGYNFAFKQGMDAINQNAAAKGLLKSGATLKRLQGYGTGLGQQYFNNYLTRLNEVANRGLQGGQLISGAGQTSSGSSNSGGLGKAIGSLATAFI